MQWVKCTLVFALLNAVVLSADQLRFDSAAQWKTWDLPGGAVEVLPSGIVRPVAVLRHANAARNARDFGGGVRGAGSNRALAGAVIDGDEKTGWAPRAGGLERDAWIEIDLGRAVSAEWIELVFDESAPPFELFEILVSNGAMMRDETRSFIEGTLVYPIAHRYVENSRHRVRLALEDPAESLVKNVRVQVLQNPVDARLTEIVVQSFGDNLVLGAIDRGGEVDIAVEVDDPLAISKGRLLAAADGLVTTAWYPTGREVNAEDTYAHIKIDLGASYRIDLLRLISSVGGRFDFRFYELETSDGSLAPDGSLVWQKHFSGVQTNLPVRQGLVDHAFTPLPARFVQVRWKFWDSNCQNGSAQNTGCFASGRTQEVQVFGQGYPEQVRLRSPILDLNGDKNVHALRWQAVGDGAARVELRTRSGNDLERETTFYNRDDKQITEKQWNRLIPSFRGRVDTSFVVGGDWSPWSSSYARSGQGFLSPSPRRYAEIEARLIAGDRGRAAAGLDWVALDYSAPLAAQVLGEVYPVQVRPGVEEEFTYFVRASQSARGFDRIALESTASLRFVGASIEGESVSAELGAEPSGFSARFPRRVREGELVELRFASEVFVQATRFDAFLQDSAMGTGVRQRVEPGDATDRVQSSTNAVYLPLDGALFVNVDFGTQCITPNGDGVNETLEVDFDLVNMLEHRPIYLRVFDAAGRRVRSIEHLAVAGPQKLVWDGMDEGGRRVVPGMYVVHLLAKGDARDQSVYRTVGVAY